MASELTIKDTINMNDSVEAGTEAETKAIQFHKFFITKINYDLPSVESLHILTKNNNLRH